MNWVRAIAGIFVLWSSAAWGATLMWKANSEQDVAGYRVYHCSQQPCTRTSGKASLLATLGKVTSFNIGTPAVTQFYIITAYDFANNESGNSNLATFTPVGSPPPPPPSVGKVSLEVVGDPATGPWGVEASINDTRNVMATVRLDGGVHHVEHDGPYGFPNDDGTTATTGLFGTGSHLVEFLFYVEGTTTEIGRASMIVREGTPSPSAVGKVSLEVVGDPATGPWGVEASINDTRNVMATVHLDGVVHHVEYNAPYGFPNDNSVTATTARFGTGRHTIEFMFYVEGTTTEIGRASVTVNEGIS